MINQTSQTSQNSYFNLHINGIGYLNDIRVVQPKKGNAFLACRIAALVGNSNEPEYRYFDCNVVGETAENLVKRCEEAVKAKRKVLISFRLSDLWVDSYTVNKDTKYHKKGDTAFSLKGRLIRINSVTVDGELKWKETQVNN
ncbi:hypothetical protein A6A19_07725 [Actinobacillus delphinicola]|nr:STY4534 family ICE replication protein [Actinobacillus delphinicola]MDG6897863.1 hypothetical protein [Actinobacillus delphinicola]